MTTETTTTLREAAVRLAVARNLEQRLADQLDAKRRLFEAEHLELISDHAQARIAREEADQLLRNLALAVYHTNGETKPAPGVEIAVATKLEYEEEAAIDFVRKVPVPSVRVATDLYAKLFPSETEVAA